ncbi:DUF1659 domain-containing protein [Halobacillus litoralis]|uniref:DUF1659 domain-containing protein n=1 Tax=Halobacillus litoralis TaxID=45668 RepID=A0A410M948_9BACI|nr:DUF1659 domain-containing protein [Halobacillus litoralis]QAS51217.1 hypothetical protein HLI_02830 [Halobacillus litoralis]
MAVISQKTDARLQLVFDKGVDADGNMVLTRKSFNNVKIAATNEQLYEVSNALATLQERILFKVERNDQSLLLEES